ncbi:MAG: restriction endonuclease [Nitrospinae bacterium]|nr:restriction endonuclease [Nitrospinota bacterium]
MAIFVITFGAFVIGIILIVSLKKISPPPPQEQIHFENPEDKPKFLIDPAAFKDKCIEFLEKFNLEYVHAVWANDRELELAMNDETPVVGGAYLALCIINPLNQTVNAIQVKGFLDTVKGEGASRGIFITTGYFTDEAIRSIDEEPVELVDVVSFVSYLKRFGIYETPSS